MADETTSTQTETTAANTFVVPVPEPGQNLTVQLEAEQVPQINFDPGTESTQEFVGADQLDFGVGVFDAFTVCGIPFAPVADAGPGWSKCGSFTCWTN